MGFGQNWYLVDVLALTLHPLTGTMSADNWVATDTASVGSEHTLAEVKQI